MGLMADLLWSDPDEVSNFISRGRVNCSHFLSVNAIFTVTLLTRKIYLQKPSDRKAFWHGESLIGVSITLDRTPI